MPPTCTINIITLVNVLSSVCAVHNYTVIICNLLEIYIYIYILAKSLFFGSLSVNVVPCGYST